jgi:phage-related protein (TIGR01555 family)
MMNKYLQRLLDRLLDRLLPEPKKPKISKLAMERFAKRPEPPRFKIKPPEIFPGVIPVDKKDEWPLAMDSASGPTYDYAGTIYGDMGFPGYARLAELTTMTEYRNPAETIANEMTRKWIKLSSIDDSLSSEQLNELETAIKDFKVRDNLRKVIMHDLYYGRAQLFVAIRGQQNSLEKPLLVTPETIKKGSLQYLTTIEPIWTTPNMYEANDPTNQDYYKPRLWFVMSKVIHDTRLLTFVGREVPDMLKPAYNFSGISLSQLMYPYVQSWQRDRASVSDIIHSFSTSGIMTNMSAVLAGDAGDDFYNRLELFNLARDNRGILALDKDQEEFFQFNIPLSGLADLLTQTKEQMCMPSHLPMIKAFGQAPSGLGATGEGEIQVWYDFVHAEQESLLRDHLKTIIDIIQLHLWGEIKGVHFEFEPLEEMSHKELAEIRKSDAATAEVLISTGVIDAMEERERLVTDANSGYNHLDLNHEPELPSDDDEKTKNAKPDKTKRSS